MLSQAPDERLVLAEAYLMEAVYRSRGAQAGAGLWSAGDPSAANCGLGREAAVELDLTPKATELYEQLWPASAPELGHLRAVTTAWVERQDALDRDRNHFLKAFRHKHGFDREDYDAQQAGAYRSGLDEVNAKTAAERRSAAQKLLGA